MAPNTKRKIVVNATNFLQLKIVSIVANNNFSLQKLVANDNFSFDEMSRKQCVHPYALRVFQQYQECNWKPYSLGSLNVTNSDLFIFSYFVFLLNLVTKIT